MASLLTIIQLLTFAANQKFWSCFHAVISALNIEAEIRTPRLPAPYEFVVTKDAPLTYTITVNPPTIPFFATIDAPYNYKPAQSMVDPTVWSIIASIVALLLCLWIHARYNYEYHENQILKAVLAEIEITMAENDTKTEQDLKSANGRLQALVQALAEAQATIDQLRDQSLILSTTISQDTKPLSPTGAPSLAAPGSSAVPAHGLPSAPLPSPAFLAPSGAEDLAVSGVDSAVAGGSGHLSMSMATGFGVAEDGTATPASTEDSAEDIAPASTSNGVNGQTALAAVEPAAPIWKKTRRGGKKHKRNRENKRAAAAAAALLQQAAETEMEGEDE